ncbi:MAG TPA: pro-sigmaK processing inhibitor BofA family protein [Candidatus Baltobacteraceae bacterium]|nr:pro-sigmaK processing inhibitor BofA family protein [Candidatus Baltobacteraceae bacterium]
MNATGITALLPALPSVSIPAGLAGELILVVFIAVVLLIVFMLGKKILKLVFGIIANSVLGLISIFILNMVLNIGIPIKVYTMVAAAVFGLPAVGTFVILRLAGVPL